MKNKILTTCFALACSAALLCAQSAQSNASGTQTQTDRSMQTDKTRTENRSTAKGSIKVTGCLAAGTEPNTFMLNNVSESGSQTSSNTSRSQSQANPSSTPSEMARTDSSYVLVASNKKIDLSKHIGQRVEVTG